MPCTVHWDITLSTSSKPVRLSLLSHTAAQGLIGNIQTAACFRRGLAFPSIESTKYILSEIHRRFLPACNPEDMKRAYAMSQTHDRRSNWPMEHKSQYWLLELEWGGVRSPQKYKPGAHSILEFFILSGDLVNTSVDSIEMKMSLHIEMTFSPRKLL